MKRRAIVNRVTVLRGEEKAGVLQRTPRGASFLYDGAYLARHRDDRGPLRGAIALHLPLQTVPHEVVGTNLHPFFAGLLPEGARYAALLRAVKTSSEDLLSLLAVAGADCVGDVAVVRGDTTSPSTPTLDLAKVGDSSFAELLAQSLDYTARGEQLTAPGAQAKISAGMISLPVRTATGSYLLKLEPNEYPRIVQNEAFMMALARQAGLPTAEVRVVRDRDGAPGLLVRRFDRNGAKLHVEDGCQLLDRYPGDKYALALADLARAVVEHSSTPVLDVAMLVRLAAFSYAVANGDLHAKNVSLLASADRSSLRMSPAYDLLTTLPYGDTSMALPIEGRDKKLRRAHFVQFAGRFGVRPPATEALLDEVCRAVGTGAARVEEIGFSARQTAHLRRTLEERCTALGRP
ncbi:MAG: HipA domain-containing protein [Myxococcales bacterium]|nr:HipA domain-containing protein [Myxococcales bacterium]